jgi:hypothetical protein
VLRQETSFYSLVIALLMGGVRRFFSRFQTITRLDARSADARFRLVAGSQ